MAKSVSVSYVLLTIVIVLAVAAAGGFFAGQSLAPARSVTMTTTVTVTGPPQPIGEKTLIAKIGLIAPLTGPQTAEGQDELRGFLMAVDEVNLAGGIKLKDGSRVRLEAAIEDQQSTREGTVAAATRLATVHKVDVVVGGFGSAFIIAAQPVIAENKIPYITSVASDRVVRRTDIDASWFFLYNEVARGHGRYIAEIISDAVKPVVSPTRNLRVAVLYQDSAFGADYWSGLNATAVEKKLPVEFVYVSKFKIGEVDFRSLLTASWAQKPDVILPIGFEVETLSAIQQGVRDLGIVTLWGPVSGGTSDLPTFYKNLGKGGEHTLMVTFFGPYHYHPSVKSKIEPFINKFKERWGASPGFGAIVEYDHVYIVAEAIRMAGAVDRVKIRDVLTKIEIDQLLLPVVGGKIIFSERRWQPLQMYGVQLIWNESVNELRPLIIWPETIKQSNVRLPPGYKPGI